jgi:Na+/melibiose symporter-like transporter
MVLVTLVHFCILSFRGNALYNYYHHYVDKGAMFDFLQWLGLTAPAGAADGGGLLETLGYIVRGDRADAANTNAAHVFNSIINMLETATIIVIILLSPGLARRFGKKAVTVWGFALAALGSLAFYFLKPGDIGGMIAMTIFIAVVYAPTIPLVWAIYADVADYSEWKTGRRFTGIVFATIGFALKCGLALGNSAFLWTMAAAFEYDPKATMTDETIQGFRICRAVVVAVLFAICTLLLIMYPLNKRSTLQMADELADRRKKFAQQAAT